MQALDYEHNAYLAVTTSSSSILDPSTFHPSATYIQQVGQLSDTHLLAVPKDMKDVVVEALRGREEVRNVEVVERKMRAKRGGGEEL